MLDPVISRFEDLARADTVAAPLAILTAESLRSVSSGVWQSGVPDLDCACLHGGKPLLAGTTIAVDSLPARELMGNLAALAFSGVSGSAGSAATLPDARALLEASINQDGDRLERLAAESAMDPALLAALGQLIALPLLQACGEKAEPVLHGNVWERGYCPVCAAWPAMAEVRGSERERSLRCGRCGTAWPWPHLKCAFCSNDDHRTLGYLAADKTREAMQATTCDRCHGYLKGVSSLIAMDAGELLLKDLSTLELDAAAAERGYGRPEAPGFRLDVRVVPV